jgi:hypothetical protein
VSSNTACDSGTRPAPNAPCSSRKITISGSEVAAPHIIEVTVNPATEARNSRRRPKRAARYPVGAVITAAATI